MTLSSKLNELKIARAAAKAGSASDAKKAVSNPVMDQVVNIRKAIATGDYRVVNKARETAHAVLGLKKVVMTNNSIQQKAVPVAVSVDQIKAGLVSAKVKAM